MKRLDRKSDCAINYSLEIVGDPWSLLIIRDIVNFGKKTFGEFLASDERIGTSVLARKLAALEQHGVITKEPSKTDKRKEEYRVTAKGLDLIPVLCEFALWGATYDPHTGADMAKIEEYRSNRSRVVKRTRMLVQQSGLVELKA
jgi:DNA-binding HxlR family transcriptional regulator